MRTGALRATYPEPVVSAGVSEVYDELEGFVVEGLEGEEHVVDEEVTVDLPHPGGAERKQVQVSSHVVRTAQSNTVSNSSLVSIKSCSI